MLYSHIHSWTQTIRDGHGGSDVLFMKSYLKSFSRIGEYDIVVMLFTAVILMVPSVSLFKFCFWTTLFNWVLSSFTPQLITHTLSLKASCAHLAAPLVVFCTCGQTEETSASCLFFALIHFHWPNIAAHWTCVVHSIHNVCSVRQLHHSQDSG